MQEEHRQQRPVLGARQADHSLSLDHVERAEDPELHSASQPNPSSKPSSRSLGGTKPGPNHAFADARSSWADGSHRLIPNRGEKMNVSSHKFMHRTPKLLLPFAAALVAAASVAGIAYATAKAGTARSRATRS